MSILDGGFVFGLTAMTDATEGTAIVSTNVYDAGSATKLFAGPLVAQVAFRVAITSDANPGINVDFRGADNAALTTLPVVLGSSGIVTTSADGTALLTGETVDIVFPIGNQTASKRYYGLFVSLRGTNSDIVAYPKQGYLTFIGGAQTNLRGAQLAVTT